MMRWLRSVQAALGRGMTLLAGAAVAVGLIGFATGLGADDRPRTYGAVLASWLFFAGAAAGAVAVRALFRLIPARWPRPMASLGAAQLGFAPIALVVLAVLVLGARAAPWLHTEPSSWMSVAGLSARELGLTAALFGAGWLLRPTADQRGSSSGTRAVLYCLAYAVVLSMWAFDFVLGADPVFESTLIGVYVFMTAFLAGTALVTLLAVLRGALDARARRDAGALILALSIFWAYLFWSQYLTIWYGNLPEEAGFALRRAEGGWGVIVLCVIGLVFALPFVTLLHPAGRRSARWLAALLVLQLVGLWLDCQLLIIPSLTPVDAPALDLRDLAIALGLLGAFALSVAPGVAAASPSLTTPIANPGDARGAPSIPERNPS